MCTYNLYVGAKAISGRAAIGLGTMTMATTTGCRARGLSRLKLVACGLRDIGAGATAFTSGTLATGEKGSASTVAFFTDSDTWALASRADTGKAATSST